MNKLDIAVQSLRGLERRAQQNRKTAEGTDLKIERIQAELELLKSRLEQHRQIKAGLNAEFLGIEEYKDEVAATVRKLFWELNGSVYDHLDFAAKNQVYYEFLDKNNIGGMK
jgi:chromosome segregation ATPase